ncbi:MAG: dephospho-CoA kinase [Elusimicrobia bacterium]|nr:dephospho-CoA kinase [Elusimicrobiota bacterium]
MSKIVIGLTGGIASGKTAAAKIFKELGAQVIFSDEIAKAQLKRGRIGFKAAVKKWGRAVLSPDGKISRRFIAAKIFKDKKLRLWFEEIVHTPTIKEIKRLVSKSRCKVIVVESPLLFEKKLKAVFDFIAVVCADKKERMLRARLRGMSRSDFLARSAVQDGRKVSRADFNVKNNFNLAELRKKIRAIYMKIKEQKKCKTEPKITKSKPRQ